jgi:hypothetical protein
MNSSLRPTEEAPGGMGGSQRMPDPGEAQRDRQRRRWMMVGLLLIAGLNVLDLWLIQPEWRDWCTVLLLAVAAVPLGLAVKVFELRFQMSRDERQQVLREVPARKQAEFVVYALLLTVLFGRNVWHVSWGLLGVWLYDFITYYHDRPGRKPPM